MLPACVLHAGVLVLALALVGCSSTLNQRAHRADGLLGFLFDYPGPNVVPVESVKAGLLGVR